MCGGLSMESMQSMVRGGTSSMCVGLSMESMAALARTEGLPTNNAPETLTPET
jgi:hypothetical protein